MSAKVAPNVLLVSGDSLATRVDEGRLEASLAGTVLLVEYDGNYRRILSWLWQYGLRRDKCNNIHLNAKGPHPWKFGMAYTLAGGYSEIPIHEATLERTWSGRLLIQGYKGQPLLLLKYL